MLLLCLIAYGNGIDVQEPLENLEGTSDEAIREYENTHPDVPLLECLRARTVDDALATEVDRFYRMPSLSQFKTVVAAAEGCISQADLYDSVTKWLLNAADSARPGDGKLQKCAAF